MPGAALSVFDYLDYRVYLNDFYRNKKSLGKPYSHRVFCRMAGISSTGYFSDVLNGRRHLSKAYVAKFARGLGLNEQEADYFELLVDFNRAKSDRARQSLYSEMIKALPPQIQFVKQSQLEYLSNWHYPAVREALSILKVKDDYQALGASLLPPLTPAKAHAAIKLLSRLELIERDEAGYWRASHVSLQSRREESTAWQLRALQGEMIVKAKEALETLPLSEREISCVCMSVSPRGLDRIKALAAGFHQRVLEVVQSDQGEDRVVQLNLQVFPLARVRGPHAPA